jgi:hypothetical protein
MKKMKFKDILELKMSILKLANNQNHKTLVIWATDCAQRVLPYFEDTQVNDNRPRKAIEAGQAWVRSGITVHDVRQAAFAAHAAARETNNQAAEYAARAAGQAAASAHVAGHAVHAATYAAKAVFYSSNLNQAYTNTVKERQWQLEHLLDLEKAT